MSRGELRVYLGAAPGVGKTFAMLQEGRRRLLRGADVVLAFVETHGRPHTAEAAEGLERVPRRVLTHRGSSFSEMDVDAVLERRPQVALVDELAHTNVPGSRNDKRWQDVEELLAAGIHVITTVNVQHLESVNDVVEKITGVKQRETVPDAVVRAADQVELVDMTPEALRRRMAHGNIYAADKVDAALANYFRVGNLGALRELALLWLADKVDEQLDRYRSTHGISETWETRERVVVALTGGSEGETLIRRAARVAARSSGGDLLAVHVTSADGLTGASPGALATQRALVEKLGGSYHQVIGDDVPTALLEFARAENATQLVLGASRRGRWSATLTGPGVGSTVARLSGDIDVHLVTHEAVGRGRLPPIPRGLTVRRQLQGGLLAVVALALLTLLAANLRGALTKPSTMLLFLLVVVAVSLVGGMVPALGAAVLGSLLINYYFTAPQYTFTISEPNNVLALGVFVVVAVLVSRIVDLAARRTSQAARAQAEAETLSTLAGSVLRGDPGPDALLERVRETFGLESVTLLEHTGDGWTPAASVGPRPCARPDEADTEVPVRPALVLALRGRPLRAEDQRLLTAFAATAAAELEQRRLRQEAEGARTLAEVDATRRALLAALSHDLRTPLASAKAAVSSLRSADVAWAADERSELLATADSALDTLTRLVADLLDLSRLQAGALSVFPRPTALEEVVPRALDSLHVPSGAVRVEVPETLPEVLADPALLERVLANLVENALRHAPSPPPLLAASAFGDRVELRVVDRGPGVPSDDRERIFAPFQRLGDTDTSSGVGLGLALSRGLLEAMSGSLTADATPGGGLTMTASLPVAVVAPLSPRAVERT